jgi:hypothetical protein
VSALVLLAPLHAWRWYLRLVLARIERLAPTHPDRLSTEREIAAVERRIDGIHRSLA